MLTIEALANLLVAIGTIILAIISYINVQIIKKQTKVLFIQSNFLRLQQAPLLKYEDFKFRGNEISLELTNVGNGIAAQIGVETGFYLVSPKLVEPPDDKSKDEILKQHGISKEDFEKVTKFLGREMWFKYVWNPDKELFTEKEQNVTSKAYPNNFITFLKKSEDSSPILEPGKNGRFKCKPKMEVKVGEQYLLGKKFPKYTKLFTFQELIELCKNNNIDYLGFKFDLVYRDLAENPQTSEELVTCVIDINHHKNFEEAVKEGSRIDFFGLTLPEIEKKIGGISKDFFYEGKSRLNDPNSFDKEFHNNF